MEVVLLKKDGRCKWLEHKVLNKLLPKMLSATSNKDGKTMYLIEDWISNDNGKVGVDINWLSKLGVPVVKTYKDIRPQESIVVNTGYDSIYSEEQELKEQGVEIIDEPCPYIRKLRTIFENMNSNYQYVLLCEPNHIIIKNYKSLYPEDMILVQLDNYKEKIMKFENGKPLYLVPYVTFLQKHIESIYLFIQDNFPTRMNKVAKTSCMWISSPSSPITEINNLMKEELEGIHEALLIATPGSVNKSLISLIETLQDKKLNVLKISSLKEFLSYKRNHKNAKVLLVRSPIPNNGEKPIMNYLERGIIFTYYFVVANKIKNILYMKYNLKK